MKTSPGQYDPLFKEYMEQMVKELKARNVKKPPSTIQAPSTQRTLDRKVEDDLAHWMRPMAPDGWKADRYYKRPISPDEYTAFNNMRATSKNTLGQSEQSGYSPAVKQKAISAFTCSPPAPLTPEQMQKARSNAMTEIKLHEPTMDDVKASLDLENSVKLPNSLFRAGWTILEFLGKPFRRKKCPHCTDGCRFCK